MGLEGGGACPDLILFAKKRTGNYQKEQGLFSFFAGPLQLLGKKGENAQPTRKSWRTQIAAEKNADFRRFTLFFLEIQAYSGSFARGPVQTGSE